jgi:dephospho-CoA kinase
MLRVGLTGGLATGKSFVGSCFVSMGCHLVHADELGHQVLAPDGEAYQGVIREFGSGILDEGGAIDRRKLAAEVFSKPDRLAVLNSLVHPAVFSREERWMEEIRAADPNGVVIVEAAILIETGSYQRFSRLILTVCSEEQQIERAMRRDGLTREEILARLSRQLPLEEKRKFADYVIDTSGSKDDTLLQTREVYNSLRSMVQV